MPPCVQKPGFYAGLAPHRDTSWGTVGERRMSTASAMSLDGEVRVAWLDGFSVRGLL